MMDIEIEVEFSQLEQEMDVEFEQSDMAMEADFGELQTVNIGLSAYQVAVKNGFEGTEEEWLESLKGDKGDTGPAGPAGPQGPEGDPGPAGADGAKGDKGDKGDTGPQGPQGPAGADGTMSFEDLTPEQKASLKGDKGDTGPAGPQGPQGDKGDPGAPGKDGVNGKDGSPGKDGADGISPVVAVEDIDGGHRVTITDKDGAKQFDVMDGEGGSGGEVHWDDVQGKPFGEMPTGGDTLYWDGNTEGLLEVPIVNDPNLRLYKIHDGVFTDDEIRQMTVSFDRGETPLADFSGEPMFTADRVVLPFTTEPFVVFVRTPNYAFTEESDPTGFLAGTAFPETGVYFFDAGNGSFTDRLIFPDSSAFPSVKTIDPKYISAIGMYLDLGAVQVDEVSDGLIPNFSAELADEIASAFKSGKPVYCIVNDGAVNLTRQTVFTLTMYDREEAYFTAYDHFHDRQSMIQLYYRDGGWRYIPDWAYVEPPRITDSEKAMRRAEIGAVSLDEVIAALPVYDGEVVTE